MVAYRQPNNIVGKLCNESPQPKKILTAAMVAVNIGCGGRLRVVQLSSDRSVRKFAPLAINRLAFVWHKLWGEMAGKYKAAFCFSDKCNGRIEGTAAMAAPLCACSGCSARFQPAQSI